MKFITDAILSLFDIVEAEGRALRENALRLCIAFVIFMVAGAMLAVAVLLVLAGIHVAIRDAFGSVRAFLATALLAGVAAAIFFKIGFKAAGNVSELPDEEKEGGDDGEQGEIGSVDGEGKLQAVDGERGPGADNT